MAAPSGWQGISKNPDVVIVECEGGTDKDPTTGHRRDSCMIQQALARLSRTCEIVYYTDASAEELVGIGAGVYLFRVNPAEYPGVTMREMERTAARLKEQGATVIPEFDTIRLLGTKQLLWHIRGLECGLPDTTLHSSAASAVQGLSEELSRGESRVLKVVFGSQVSAARGSLHCAFSRSNPSKTSQTHAHTPPRMPTVYRNRLCPTPKRCDHTRISHL